MYFLNVQRRAVKPPDPKYFRSFMHSAFPVNRCLYIKKTTHTHTHTVSFCPSVDYSVRSSSWLADRIWGTWEASRSLSLTRTWSLSVQRPHSVQEEAPLRRGPQEANQPICTDGCFHCHRGPVSIPGQCWRTITCWRTGLLFEAPL